MANKQSTIFIIENDEAEAKSLAHLITSMGYKIVSYFTLAEEFLKSYQDDPGCLLLDACMPHISGLELQDILIKQKIKIPIIFTSAYGDIPMAIQAIKKGAIDFLTKPINSHILLEAINHAIKQDFNHREKEKKRNQILKSMKQLTLREIEIMKLIVRGESTKEIAKKLSISTNTVELHRSKIMKKMQVKTINKLVVLILANDMFQPNFL